jgi:hypothetical protein
LLRGFFLSLDLARLSGRLPPLYILYYFVCPNGPPPIPLLPVPADMAACPLARSIESGHTEEKKPQSITDLGRVGGHIFLKHTNAKAAERATYWAVSLLRKRSVYTLISSAGCAQAHPKADRV